MISYRVIDLVSREAVVTTPDELARDVAPWFPSAPDDVYQAIDALAYALMPGHATAHEQEALTAFLALTVIPLPRKAPQP